MIRRWLERRRCFHHNHTTGVSWITGELVDLGRAKLFRCVECGKVWI